MAIQFIKLFQPIMLTGSAATIYTMPATPAGVVLRNARIRFTNIDTAAHAVTVYAVPSGGSASTTNECLPAVSIPPNGYIDVDIPQLAVSDFIQAFADTASKVNAQAIDGVLQS